MLTPLRLDQGSTTTRHTSSLDVVVTPWGPGEGAVSRSRR